MNRLRLLLRDGAMLDLLQEWLSHYELILPQSQEALSKPFQLCITDTQALPMCQAQAQARSYLTLLLASSEDLATLDREKLRDVSGILIVPFEQVELLAWVRALLKIAGQSSRIKTMHDKLIRVTKAFESTSDAISIADTDGRAIYLNQAFKDMYGFSLKELNVGGVPDLLFVNPQTASEIFDSVQNGIPWKGETLLKNRQGAVVPTLLRVDSIADDADTPLGMISVHTDITERRWVETVQREHQVWNEALIDTATTLTRTLDLDEVLDRILENIGRVVPHDMAHIILQEDGAARVVRSKGVGDAQTDEWLLSQRFHLTEVNELWNMAQSRRAIVVPRVPPSRSGTSPLGLNDIQSYIAAPILLDQTLTGFLFLSSKEPDFFTTRHADQLQAFAEHAGIAIRNAQLHIKAQELAALEERQRLAHNLHDAISQTLFSATMIAEALPQLLDREPEKTKQRLEQLHRLTRGAMAELRALLYELRPAALVEMEFGDLLRQLTDSLQGQTRIRTSLQVEGQRTLPPDVQTALFYITQEALNNVVKHAGASRVNVYLRNDPGELELAITDDGRGFAPEQIRPTSLGLAIMRERAEAIGAVLTVSGQNGLGTRVVITWAEREEKVKSERSPQNQDRTGR